VLAECEQVGFVDELLVAEGRGMSGGILTPFIQCLR